MSKRADKIEEMFKLVSELESGNYDRQRFARLHGMSVSNRTADAVGLLAASLSSAESGGIWLC